MIKKLISILFITCISTFIPITIYADNQHVTYTEYSTSTEYYDNFDSSEYDDYYNSSEYHNRYNGESSIKDNLYELFLVYMYLIFGLFFTNPIAAIIVLLFSIALSIFICRKIAIKHSKEYTECTSDNSFSYNYKVTEIKEVKNHKQ